MKVPVYSTKGEKTGEMNLAKAFSQPVRKDLIKKAVLYEQSLTRQAYGADPLAGKRTSAHYHGRRGIRHSMMNREMARMKRIHGQGHLNFTARFVPQAVKGRKAHPPKAEKIWEKKMNKKEFLKALLSAVSATGKKEMVEERGHKITGVKHVPMVIDDNFQELKKAKEVREALHAIGFDKDLERAESKKVRAGRGTMRGRKYTRKKGPLIVVGEDKGIEKAGRNLAGVDIVTVKNLSLELLAPGTHPGRLCLWTKSAMNELDKLN
ncbi:MAG: 50S ribosomal protein L4 [Candidatus Aenigmatarchaeota archaeon]